MFTKYFGLFLIAGGAIGAISFLFKGLNDQCSIIFMRVNSVSVYVPCTNKTPKIKSGEDLFFGILISVAIVLVTFSIGRYLYKIGKIKKTLANIEGNKLVKIAVTLYVASIVIIPMAYLAARINCGNRLNNYVCNSSVISLGSSLEFVFLGIFPAIIMSGVAIILLIIHWLKNRGLKYKQ